MSANPSVRTQNDPADYPNCSICTAPSSYSRKDVTGFKHHACGEHEPYLAGWVQDANHESISDSAASARYEEAGYGRRDE